MTATLCWQIMSYVSYDGNVCYMIRQKTPTILLLHLNTHHHTTRETKTHDNALWTKLPKLYSRVLGREVTHYTSSSPSSSCSPFKNSTHTVDITFITLHMTCCHNSSNCPCCPGRQPKTPMLYCQPISTPSSITSQTLHCNMTFKAKNAAAPNARQPQDKIC